MKRITTLKQLHKAVQNRRSVICPRFRVWSNPRPAAFVMHLPGCVLYSMIKRGMYLYDRRTKCAT